MILSKYRCKVGSAPIWYTHLLQAYLQVFSNTGIENRCSLFLSAKNTPHTETTKSTCDVNQLTGFYMIWIFAGFIWFCFCYHGLSTNIIGQFYPSAPCQRNLNGILNRVLFRFQFPHFCLKLLLLFNKLKSLSAKVEKFSTVRLYYGKLLLSDTLFWFVFTVNKADTNKPIFTIKDTVLQTEQVLTNNCLRVWNVSGKLSTPTFYDFIFIDQKKLAICLCCLQKKCIEINKKLYRLVMRKLSRYFFHM